MRTIDEFMRNRYQWLADLVFSYFPGVSPWIMSKHFTMGGNILFTIHFAVANKMIMFVIIGLLGLWVVIGLTRACDRKHAKWLKGEEVLPEITGISSRLIWLFMTIIGFVYIELATIACPLIMTGLYFYACGSPTNIRSRKLVHAGI